MANIYDDINGDINDSIRLMVAILKKDGVAAAEVLDEARRQQESLLRTLNKMEPENVRSADYIGILNLGTVVSSALHYSMIMWGYNYKTIIPRTKDFIGIVLSPSVDSNSPMILMELRSGEKLTEATKFIPFDSWNYADDTKAYEGRVLLVDVNYNTRNDKHFCQIQEINLKHEVWG